MWQEHLPTLIISFSFDQNDRIFAHIERFFAPRQGGSPILGTLILSSSSICLSPSRDCRQRHRQLDTAVLMNRHKVYEAAKQRMPERWRNRSTRNWTPIQEVWLNPSNEKPENTEKLKVAAWKIGHVAWQIPGGCWIKYVECNMTSSMASHRANHRASHTGEPHVSAFVHITWHDPHAFVDLYPIKSISRTRSSCYATTIPFTVADHYGADYYVR